MSKTIESNNPIQTYELSISCKELKDADIFSKSDPMVVMYVQSLIYEWREVGRTEHIMNTLNPEFVKKFFIDDFPSETQYLKFKVYDIDKDSPDLKEHDFIGWAECELHSILAAPRKKLTLDLDLIDEDDITENDKSKSNIKGSITIKAEKLNTTRKWINMRWEAKHLVKPSLLTSLNPFMVFSRIYEEDNSFTVSHKTEVMKNDLNPEWRIIEISAGELCGENLDRKLKIEIYDYNRNGSHSLIGEFEASLEVFEKSPRTHKCFLPNPRSRVNKTTGTVFLADFKMRERKSFEDHISESTTLSPIIAIDFSKPGKKTVDQKTYEVAIKTVCDVIQEKRKDGDLFQAFGFAAEYINGEPFPLNLIRQSPECIGCDEVIKAYKECMGTLASADSKSISPIIRKMTRMYKMAFRKLSKMHEYFILIVLVNAGELSDLEKTKESIVEASKCPMSIVFVGMGDGNFQEVEQLQGHIWKLPNFKNKVKQEEIRDIVHFVRFRDFTSNNNCEILSMPRLAKEILRKIPDQFMEYAHRSRWENLQVQT